MILAQDVLINKAQDLLNTTVEGSLSFRSKPCSFKNACESSRLDDSVQRSSICPCGIALFAFEPTKNYQEDITPL